MSRRAATATAGLVRRCPPSATAHDPAGGARARPRRGADAGRRRPPTACDTDRGPRTCRPCCDPGDLLVRQHLGHAAGGAARGDRGRRAGRCTCHGGPGCRRPRPGAARGGPAGWWSCAGRPAAPAASRPTGPRRRRRRAGGARLHRATPRSGRAPSAVDGRARTPGARSATGWPRTASRSGTATSPRPGRCRRTGPSYADTPGQRGDAQRRPAAVTAEVLRRLRAAGSTSRRWCCTCGVSSPEADEPPYAGVVRVPAATAGRGQRDPGRRPAGDRGRHDRGPGAGVAPTRDRCRAEGWTELVIGPATRLSTVDGLLTGWHAPEASHLRMLAAVAGADAAARPRTRSPPSRATAGTSSATCT